MILMIVAIKLGSFGFALHLLDDNRLRLCNVMKANACHTTIGKEIGRSTVEENQICSTNNQERVEEMASKSISRHANEISSATLVSVFKNGIQTLITWHLSFRQLYHVIRLILRIFVGLIGK